jgi:transcriptional regulator with XRE-family HTH domain
MQDRQASPAGKLLKYWREVRGMSQGELAAGAEISARHLSFIETGRARPSLEVVMVLASALELPLSERNALLRASGHAPAYESGSIESPELASLREMARMTIDQVLPNSAIVIDRQWNIVLANARAETDLDLCLGPAWRRADRVNIMKLLFSSRLAQHLDEWPRHAGAMLGRLRREDASSGDREVAELHDVLRAEPSAQGVPYRTPAPTPLSYVVMNVGGTRVAVRATVTSLGTPEDIGTAGYRVICLVIAADARPAFEALLAHVQPRMW